MIDPKLNELPGTKSTGKAAAPASGTPQQRSKTPREGLSVNDTIAGDTLLSTGVPGVDTSGVRAGSGAGAGSSSLTPGYSASPAPNVVSGARETGMTPGGSNTSGTGPTGQAGTGVPGPGRTDAELTGTGDDITGEEISARAYDCWCERGCPEGSPDIDWQLAQEQLRAERRRQTRTAAAAS